MLRCLIIDDEEIARRGIANYTLRIPFIDLVRTCDSAFDALESVSKDKIDLIFLDIQMPKLNGLEFLKSFPNPPMIVICSAYPNYAIAGFELDVMDYLVKPFSFDRFLKACNKCNEYHELKGNLQSANEDFLFIKADSRIEKVETGEILFIEALENYIAIYTAERKYMTLLGLGVIESRLSPRDFIKVQKSFIVSKSKIDALEGNTICIGSYRIPISRKWKDEILSNILSNKFLRR